VEKRLRPALWVELCAGSAAVTLRLIGGAGARPPVAYIGSKRAYARAILNVMGLHSGDGADGVVLVEAGPWAKVWAALAQPAVCSDVVRILRSWSDEDPKALWDRLKVAPVPVDPAGYTAAWTFLQARNFSGCQVGEKEGWLAGGFKSETPADGSERWKTSEAGPADVARTIEDAGHVPWPSPSASGDWPGWVARWLWLNGRSFGSKGEDFGFDGDHGFNPDQQKMARAVEAVGRLRWPQIDPAHVAQWIFQQGASYGGLFGTGHCGFNYRSQHDVQALARDSGGVGSSPWPALAVVQADAFDIFPPDPLPDPTYVYMDPPYADVTGYQHDLPRERVLEVARRWSDAGAIVCVSEDDPLPLAGWHHVNITECHTGMSRTFSRSRAEWLTMNREPAWIPPTQEAWALETSEEDLKNAEEERARRATFLANTKAAPASVAPKAEQFVMFPAPASDGQRDLFDV